MFSPPKRPPTHPVGHLPYQKVAASRAICLSAILIFAAAAAAAHDNDKPGARTPFPGGELRIAMGENEKQIACPLQHTDVRANIAGFVGRTTVTQVFQNPLSRKIEAVYVFPLPQDAAIDDMRMTVGDRVVIGDVKPRDEAREVYEAAKAAGHVASLLDQERPNIFTQSVANIEPGAQVRIEISYVETLKFEDGVFEYMFPMVVGPRYIPGGGSAQEPMTKGTPTAQVPDAQKITPPVTPEDKRAGHDISLRIDVQGGTDLHDLKSELHDVNITSSGPGSATIQLKNQSEIPNRDFVLHYRLATDKIENGYLVERDPNGLFFTAILMPPPRPAVQAVMPRELVFVLDTSGSMHGFPIDKAKEVMSKAIGALRPADTFNLITFSGDTHILWEQPRPANPANIKAAQAFLASRQGEGGTEMMKAIDAALVQAVPMLNDRGITPAALADLPADGREVALLLDYSIWSRSENANETEIRIPVRDGLAIRVTPTWSNIPFANRGGVQCPVGVAKTLRGNWLTVKGERVLQAREQSFGDLAPAQPIRVVCFMTDGYVGNDMAIIDAVKKNAGTTRVFSFGIGNSVNRFLLDGMAAAGRGEVEYVLLNGEAETAVTRFSKRIDAPVLTDISVDWGTLPVEDIEPRMIPDLWSAKPIMIHGLLKNAVDGRITLRGMTANGPYEASLDVTIPMSIKTGMPADGQRSSLASLWARTRIGELMMGDMAGLQNGAFPADLKQKITDLGVNFRLLTQFTSFVAVEKIRVTVGGQPMLIDVPVEMPDGVSYEGIFGGEAKFDRFGGAVMLGRQLSAAPASAAPVSGPAPTGSGGHEAAKRAQAKAKGGDKRPGEMADDATEALAIATPAQKLATDLKDLAAKVEKEGTNGEWTAGALHVTNYKLAVMIYVTEMNDATQKALEALGFEKLDEAKAVRALIGTVDVRKLAELAKLGVVLRIEPLKGGVAK